ncbi:MAG: LPS export ABC transporter permease LptF [Pseudomonadota bacterium]
MTRFDRYMLSRLMVLFGFFSLVLVGIYWVNRAVLLFDHLISDGQSAGTFLVFAALSLPAVIRIMLPLAAFAATVYVTNRMASDSELLVIQSTGQSIFRMARPVLVFGAIVAVLISILMHFLEPASRAELAKREVTIANDITARFLRPGEFLHPASQITFYIREIDARGVLQSVYLRDGRDIKQDTTYVAESALVVPSDDGPVLILFDGVAQTVQRPDQRLSLTRFQDFAFEIRKLIGVTGPGRPEPRALTSAALWRADPADLERTNATLAVFRFELNDRIAQPILAMVAALMGYSCLMIGGFSRFGFWRQVGLAIIALAVLKSIDNAMVDLAVSNVAYWPALYIPSVLGLALSAIFLWIASHPGLFRRKSARGGRVGPVEAATT